MNECEDSTAQHRSAAMQRLRDCLRIAPNRVVAENDHENPPEIMLTTSNDSVPVLLDIPVGYQLSNTQFNSDNPCESANAPGQFIQPRRTVDSVNTMISRASITNRQRIIRSLFHVWDNRLSLKMFGSKRKIREEQERQEKCSAWVIHPCSKFR